MSKNCSFEALRVIIWKKFRNFSLGCFFQKILVSGGLALIQRFSKNTFWNRHIICSSKLCITPLILYIFYFVFPLWVAVFSIFYLSVSTNEKAIWKTTFFRQSQATSPISDTVANQSKHRLKTLKIQFRGIIFYATLNHSIYYFGLGCFCLLMFSETLFNNGN